MRFLERLQGEGLIPEEWIKNNFVGLFSEDDDFPLGFWKGHLNMSLCINFAKGYFAEDSEPKQYYMVKHSRCRLVPRVNLDYDSEFLMDKSGRGAFPATVLFGQ